MRGKRNTILLIDGDAELSTKLQQALSSGYTLEPVVLFRKGWQSIPVDAYPLLVIGPSPRPVTSHGVKRTIQFFGQVCPVLVIEHSAHWRQPVTALDLGADDWVPSSISIPELAARMRALIRRGQLRRFMDYPLQSTVGTRSQIPKSKVHNTG